jgi:hypothetical protein
LEKLRAHSAGLPYVRYQLGYGPDVTAKAGLDAFWVTLTAGVELFGAAPPFPLHEARILPTPMTQLERGFPRYGIIGVAVSQDDPKSPEYNLRLVITALLTAVNDFNSRHRGDEILRVGILPDDLELRRLTPEVAFKMVRQVYEGC